MKTKSFSLFLMFCILLNINLFAQTAATFNGVNQYTNAGVIANINQSVTVELWIRPNGNTGNTWNRFVDANFVNNFAFTSVQGNANSLNVALGNNPTALTVSNALSPNVWQHIAFTFNHINNNLRLFKDGVLISSVTASLGGRNSSNIVTIGANASGGEAFNGSIDQVRIWNVVRTDAEISANYQTCLNSSQTGLVLLYDFENINCNIVNNLATANNSGTLINGVTTSTGICTATCTTPTISSTTDAGRVGTGTITLSATASVGVVRWYSAATCGTLLHTGTSFTTPSISTTTNYWVEADNNGCLSTTRTQVIASVYNAHIWTGNTNSNWNEASNWITNEVPPNGANIEISSSYINSLNLGQDVTVANFTVIGNSVVINTNQTLTVTGVLTNDGLITIENGGALVQGTSSTLAGSGNYIVKRNLDSGQKFIGSPVNNHSVDIFGLIPSGPDGAQIIPQPNCNATAIDSASPYGVIMELREDATPLHNCTQSLWHVKSAGNLTNARGYSTSINFNTILQYAGTINNGNISYANLGRQANLLDQPSTGQQTGGWHLVSNPYPSPIRLINNSLGAGWDNSVHFFDGTNFVTVQLNLTNAVIPVGQAFQIRKSAVGGSANFSVTNSMREGGNPTFYAPTQLTQEHINVTLSNNQYQSKTTVYFEDGATSIFDPQYDAVKLFGAHYLPQLYTVETSDLAEKLAYNALTPLYQENQQSLVMGAFTPTAGDFQLTFDGSNTVSGTVVLEDKKLNTFTNITENLTYSFTTVDGDNMDRFVLHFDATPDNTSARNKMEGTIKMFPNPSADYTTLMFPEKHPFNTINIVDLSGRTVKTFEIKNQNNALQIDTKEMNKGIYFVQILGASNTEVLKLMVK
jgi:hypothetical protein